MKYTTTAVLKHKNTYAQLHFKILHLAKSLTILATSLIAVILMKVLTLRCDEQLYIF